MPPIVMPPVAASSRIFDLALPDLALARGGVVKSHRARGWWWSREGDTPENPQLWPIVNFALFATNTLQYLLMLIGLELNEL